MGVFSSRASVPPVTRFFLSIITILSIIVFCIRITSYSKVSSSQVDPNSNVEEANIEFNQIIVPIFQMVPNLIKYTFWTILTSGLIESTILGYLITIIICFYGVRYTERVWGISESIKFIILLIVLSNLSLLFISLLFFQKEDEGVAYDGCLSINVGYLVAFKQLIPEHSIVLFKGLIRIRVKHLAVLFLVLISGASIVFGSVRLFVQGWSGFFVSWTYLRFYQVGYVEPILASASEEGSTKVRGDASDDFSLANFFGEPVGSRVVAPVSNAAFQVLVAVKLCTPFDSEEVQTGNERAKNRTAARTAAAPAGTKNKTADRRRAMAMDILEQRLAAEKQKAKLKSQQKQQAPEIPETSET